MTQWKLAPIEPTEEMLRAGYNGGDVTPPRTRNIWQAMLNAAPSPAEDIDLGSSVDYLTEYLGAFSSEARKHIGALLKIVKDIKAQKHSSCDCGIADEVFEEIDLQITKGN